MKKIEKAIFNKESIPEHLRKKYAEDIAELEGKPLKEQKEKLQ